MSTQRRFTQQFFIQFTLLTVFFLISSIALLAIMGMYGSNEEIKHDLTQATAPFFEQHIVEKNQHFTIDEELKQSIEQQNRWLIVYGEEGTVLTSHNVPNHLKPQLSTLFLQQLPIYDYDYWRIEPYNKTPYIIVLGSENPAKVQLSLLREEMDWRSETLPDLQIQEIVYYIDEFGRLLDAKNNPFSIFDVSTIQTLHEGNYKTAQYTDPETMRILLVASPSPVWSEGIFSTASNQAVLLLMAILFSFFIAATLYYAKKFGSPLVYMMQWIRQLGNEQYEPPTLNRSKHFMFTKKGTIKRKYKLYEEMIETLQTVTTRLKSHEQQRIDMDRMREEWISGLSHDLKTTLSSINGYVKMLRSDYQWSDEEIRSFLEIMDEKSNFMMELIEDLTLTYRLKNNGIPLQLKIVDINEMIRRTIIHLHNSTLVADYTLNFIVEKEEIFSLLDPKWLQRILDNVIINAIKHNEKGTIITIKTYSNSDYHEIQIIDNGKGMDVQTKQQLFKRYYRGTNTTDEKEGTGLGMAITKQLILLHQGDIKVQSEKNVGTVIIIQFPKAM